MKYPHPSPSFNRFTIDGKTFKVLAVDGDMNTMTIVNESTGTRHTICYNYFTSRKKDVVYL
jgi:hypothetical protein